MKFCWNQSSVLSGKGFSLDAECLSSQNAPNHSLPAIAIKIDENPAKGIVNLFRSIDQNHCFRLTAEEFPENDKVNADFSHFGHAPGTSPPSFIIQTGGTTGNKKQILRLQNTWIQSFKINQKKWSISNHDSYGILGDLTHSISFYGLMEGLFLGTNVTLLYDWLPSSQFHEIAKRKLTVLYATPIQLKLLLRAFEIHQFEPNSTLRRIIVGGSKLSSPLVTKLENIFPKAIITEFYGTTETSFITVSNPDTPQGSVGKAYKDVIVRVVNESGDVLPSDVTGNIEVTSPYLFEGYIIDGKFSSNKTDFYQTGERGFLDKNGNLFLMGRKDRMINILDVNVQPEEIESYLETFEHVNMAYVYPELDKYKGTQLQACLFYEIKQPDISDITKRCRKELGNYKTPKSYRLIGARPPLLASGKLNLRSIQTKLEQGIW